MGGTNAQEVPVEMPQVTDAGDRGTGTHFNEVQGPRGGAEAFQLGIVDSSSPLDATAKITRRRGKAHQQLCLRGR